jgi:tetratricopeptide (TPR) repeat protein
MMLTCIEGAVNEFEKAIALDREYALAHAEFAIATILLWNANYGDLAFTEVTAMATPHAQQAMALDPNLAEAHAATGLLFKSQSEYEDALTHYKEAIQINPNYSIVHNWMAHILYILGRYEESFLMQEKALRLDPLSKPAIHSYVMGLISRDRLDEANRELVKIASIYPAEYADLSGELAGIHWKWANFTLGSLDAFRINMEGVFRNNLSFEFALIGLEQESLAMYETPGPEVLRILGKPGDAVTTAEADYAENPARLWSRRNLGMALAAAGDYDRARPILEEMWQR